MKRPDPFWRYFALCGVANFLVFWVAAVLLGGDALNGSAAGGHYYLWSRGHLTEVSRGVWIYSWAHAFFTFTTFPILFILAVIDAFRNSPVYDRFRGVRWLWSRLFPRARLPK
jgi:hypothetical protein